MVNDVLTRLSVEEKHMSPTTAQMNIVRLNRFCTSTEDILCKADGKCMNSSAMTRVNAAQSTMVVNAKATSSFMHRGNIIV